MVYEKINLSTNKNIYIIDNLFTEIEKNQLFKLMSQRQFTFKGDSRSSLFKIKSSAKQYIQSFLTKDDYDHLNFCSKLNSNQEFDFLKDYFAFRSYVFLSDHTTQHYFHTDPGSYTLLYYLNTEWDVSYGGETMFACDSLQKVLYTSLYVPGRILLYNSSILHKMAAPSSSCPFHRFSYIINFEHRDNNFCEDNKEKNIEYE